MESKDQPAPETKPVATAPAAEKPKLTNYKTWLSKTGLYGFELFMAGFGLTVAAIVIDYGLFAFFNYIKGMEDGATRVVGEFSLWIVAAMLVWLPLALVFYLRSRGEALYQPARRQSRLHKVLMSLYYFVNILIAAGAVFTVLYSLIKVAVGSAELDVDDMLVRVTLPAVIMALLHMWLLFAFSNWKLASRKIFALALGVFGVLVMLGLIIASFGTVRGVAMDQKRVEDLDVISSKIRSEYSNKRQLPESLNDLEFDENELKNSLDEYTYDRKLGGRYELCTDFSTDTRRASGHNPNDDYSMYTSFYSHDKGRECFKLAAGYSTPSYDYRKYD